MGIGLLSIMGASLMVTELAQYLGLDHARLALALGAVVCVGYVGLAVARTASTLRTMQVEVSGNSRITVRVGDFVDNVRVFPGASCAFGVNDEFSVKGLQPDSAHAAFLGSFFDSDDEQTQQRALDDARLRSVTRGSDPAECDADRYPYGTVVQQPFEIPGETGTRYAFLVANSSRRKHGFAGDRMAVYDPVACVLAAHRASRYHSHTLVIALLGTGHSHTQNSMQSVFRVIDGYLSDARSDHGGPRLIGHLVISVPERLVIQEGFDLDAVHLYLKARARMEALLASGA